MKNRDILISDQKNYNLLPKVRKGWNLNPKYLAHGCNIDPSCAGFTTNGFYIIKDYNFNRVISSETVDVYYKIP